MTQPIVPALGIDLGTTNSAAAVIFGEKVMLVPDENGSLTHASALAFDENNQVYVGNGALEVSGADTFLFSLKRLIGIHLDRSEEKKLAGQYPYKVVSGARNEPFIVIDKVRYAIPELCGMILRYLKDCAEEMLQFEIERAVITVPAHFTDNQRQMTRLASELAGLKTLRIINEPTAAALGYGFGRASQKRLAVYDLGGGTFDVTVLDLDDNIIEVLATDGDGQLGGDDFDRSLLQYLYDTLGLGLKVEDAPRAHIYYARQLKHELTERSTVNVDSMVFDNGLGELRLKRSDVDNLWKPFIDRTIEVCARAIHEAGTRVAEIDHIILVGGSSRIPAVRMAVARFFQQPPITDVDPDTVVAVGAATQAYALIAAGFTEPENLPLLIDVLPQTLGIASVDGTIEHVIPKNSVVPVKVRRTFSTAVNNQSTVRIKVYQGDSSEAERNTKLGEVILDGIPPAPKGDISVDVVFEIDVNGCLTVRATDYVSGNHNEVQLYISSGYDDDTLDEMRSRSGLTPLSMNQRR